MLDFLVTSTARRRLMHLLWGRGDAGSTSQLAELAGVGYASAYRELRSMEALGLVVSERQGGAQVYRANQSHALADALRALVTASVPSAAEHPDRQVRGQLAALGAPVQHEPVEPPRGPVEDTVVRGVHLAHHDPDVARTLPVLLYRQRDRLDPARLHRHAVQLGEKRSLGFFLDLTAELSGDRRFAAWATTLRDRRCKAPHAFFHAASRSRRQHRLAEERTPPVARRWGLRMNMDVNAFRSTFEKFVPHAA
jgi:hypothetical protein